MTELRGNELRKMKRAIWAAANLRYYIRLQWQYRGPPPRPRFNRVQAVLPILFPTSDAAWEYIRTHNIFRNLGDKRKLSCSVELVRLRRKENQNA